jgi:hypothetical protein
MQDQCNHWAYRKEASRIQTKITVMYEVLNIIDFIRVMCHGTHNQVIISNYVPNNS